MNSNYTEAMEKLIVSMDKLYKKNKKQLEFASDLMGLNITVNNIAVTAKNKIIMAENNVLYGRVTLDNLIDLYWLVGLAKAYYEELLKTINMILAPKLNEALLIKKETENKSLEKVSSITRVLSLNDAEKNNLIYLKQKYDELDEEVWNYELSSSKKTTYVMHLMQNGK